MFPDEAQLSALKSRERYNDAYLLNNDPIYADRLMWHANTFRHLVHLLPGETILEVGAGRGLFVDALAQASRRRNPITAVTFDPELAALGEQRADAEWVAGASLPDGLKAGKFDYVVLQNILDDRYAPALMEGIYSWLASGGRVVFFESNPWNLFHMVKSLIKRITRRPLPQNLLSQPELYRLISEFGFIRISIRFTDFVYPPLPRSLIWLFKNLSVVLENTPYIRTLAGRILISAQKPPRDARREPVALSHQEALRGKVTVVIPCHNEQSNVTPLVTGLLGHYGAYIHQIILVDDNSTDDTRAVIEALAEANPCIVPVIRTPPNGVGRAIREGLARVESEYVLSMDCDFQHLLPELEDIFDAAAKGYDAVVGSRFSPQSILINYPVGKIFANRAFHLLFSLLFRRRYRDLTNNLKLMRTDVMRRLVLEMPTFAINAEIGLQLVLMGCRVEEVPISWIDRSFDMGTSSFRIFQVGGGYLRVLARFALETRFGFRTLRREPTVRLHGETSGSGKIEL